MNNLTFTILLIVNCFELSRDSSCRPMTLSWTLLAPCHVIAAPMIATALHGMLE